MLRPVRQVPLTKRVLRAVSHRRVPLHFAFIAKQLGHPTPDKVRIACWCLAQQGRLFSYGEGVYGLPENANGR